MKQVTAGFGSLKIDDGGDTMMSSDAIYYCDDFGQYNLRLLVQFTACCLIIHCISTHHCMFGH